MRVRIPREVEQRYTRVVHLPVSMPADDAPDVEWDAWADLQQLQAILAGWASRVGRELPRMREDASALEEVRHLTASPSLSALIGEVAVEARAVSDELFELLRSSCDGRDRSGSLAPCGMWTVDGGPCSGGTPNGDPEWMKSQSREAEEA